MAIRAFSVEHTSAAGSYIDSGYLYIQQFNVNVPILMLEPKTNAIRMSYISFRRDLGQLDMYTMNINIYQEFTMKRPICITKKNKKWLNFMIIYLAYGYTREASSIQIFFTIDDSRSRHI